ncbi:bifunctional DNA primase/polymerase-like protein [Nonomuraea fuscirosea]|uniref:Bifunctional DNA primase/polymerase-like protein n=1 Tax=Nonomuraea fuscirosea TaxID=1291556 RepID=A0A2T0LLY5_9ACTN|nr:bifunctional DNA primase/polymerase [Nonomuraea fuscirosea]PRX44051.1 bifunctional DNA primase/polymerase-like protein [Nonomuraea fuscirosea]
MTLHSDYHGHHAAPPLPRPLAIALWCAGQSWPVHPLRPGAKTPVANCSSCGERGHTTQGCPCLKQGRWCHGFLAATLDEELITSWWTHTPGFGVGVACGPARLVVIDIDAHLTPVPERGRLLPGISIDPRVDLSGLANGFHTLALLAALRDEPSPADDESTLRVRTPSGGMHVWYRAAPGETYLCSTGSGSGRGLAWQVDVRAAGGYIIAPGTRTKDGSYITVGACPEPAPLPAWLRRELVRTGHLVSREAAPQTPAVPPRARLAVLEAAGGAGTVGDRTLRRLIADVEACHLVPEGAGFSAKLNRAAYTAGGLVAAGYLTHDAALAVLIRAAQHARPGQERRFERIIGSGLAAGQRRPFHPQDRL